MEVRIVDEPRVLRQNYRIKTLYYTCDLNVYDLMINRRLRERSKMRLGGRESLTVIGNLNPVFTSVVKL